MPSTDGILFGSLINRGYTMRQRQRGITAIGFVLIAALVGLIGYGVLRLFPVYMTQMKIRKLLTDLKVEYDNNGANQGRLLRHAHIQNLLHALNSVTNAD